MFKIKKKSRWTFVTSAGGSAGASRTSKSPIFVTGGAGKITLKAPGGSNVVFDYGVVGVGVGFKGVQYSFAGSSEDNFSVGAVYLLEGCSGAELTSKDMEGFCITHDASASAIKGFSGTGMLLGIPMTSVPGELVKNTGALGIGAQLAVDHPGITKALLGPVAGFAFDKIKDPLNDSIRSKAKALLLMGGETGGRQTGLSIAGTVGYVWTGGGTQTPVSKVPDIVLPTGPEEVSTRWSSTSQDEASVIRLSGDMLFDFDAFNIKSGAEATLLKVAAHIRQKSPRYISVEGHTDAIGGATYNMQLSGLRARSIARWLAKHNVMAASSIVTKAWGKSQPAAPNQRPDGSDDADGRAKNRRVEIFLVK